jgi:acid stress chaperone HdeB
VYPVRRNQFSRRPLLGFNAPTPEENPVTTFRAAALAIGLLAATSAMPAHAQKVDLSTVTCKQFLESSKENIGLILMWLTGFYADEDAPPIIDFDKMKGDAEKLSAYCTKNPTAGLITAADEVLDK